MWDIFHYTFMQRALLAGTIVGALCALVGVYVVLKGMSFIGAGISHASFGGVALGILLGLNPMITTVIFCMLTAFGIGMVSRKGEIKEDTAVGIFFSATMAFGVLLIGFLKGYNIDLFGYLFGSILAVTQQDVLVMVILGGIVFVTVVAFFKELMCISFDPEMAEVIGVPVGKIYFLLLGVITLTIVVSIKVVGIILVSALMVIPAATAFQLTEDFRWMMLFSVLLGMGASIGGLFFSYLLDTASGATIVLLSTLIFFIVTLFSPRRYKLPVLLKANQK